MELLFPGEDIVAGVGELVDGYLAVVAVGRAEADHQVVALEVLEAEVLAEVAPVENGD